VPDLTSRTPGAAPTANWDTFSADVTIRRQIVKQDGTLSLKGPDMRYRWVRTLGASGWKTTMTLVSAAPDIVSTSKGPQAVSRKIPVSRIEIGDAGTPTRLFDADGRMLFMLPTRAEDGAGGDAGALDAVRRATPTTATRAALAHTASLGAPNGILGATAAEGRSRDWIEHILPTVEGRAARRTALVRELGTPSGGERGLERFLSHAGGATTEVLTDPAWAVPVEINVVRDGALVSHSVLSYATDPGAGLVRRRIRSEQLMSPESGDRAVVDFELANITLDRGGVR
jgi:hypothetical protein